MNEKADNIIYLDSASTAKPSPEVLDFLAYSLNSYANPDSMHGFGLDAEKQVGNSRNIIASSLNINKTAGDIIFTSSGTEANNLALFGAAEALKNRGNKIITTDIEHPSVYAPMLELEKKGFEVVFLSAKNGRLDLDKFKNSLCEKVILISAMLINNETGGIFESDIKEIIKITESLNLRGNLYIHCDAVQAYGKINIDLNRFKLDMMSASSHKIHGIKGSGALFLRKGRRIIPQIFGGGQENNYRSSTLNTPGIFAFGKAAAEASENLYKNQEYINNLFDYAVLQIKQKCPDVMFNFIDLNQNLSKYILSLRLPYNIKSEVMQNYLSGRKIYISSGSACSEKRRKSHESNRVLLNSGLNRNEADSTIRISFSKYNTADEIDGFVSALKDGLTVIKN